MIDVRTQTFRAESRGTGDRLICRQCGEGKLMWDFYRHDKESEARMRVCKECHRTNVKENRRLKRDFYRERQRIRRQAKSA